MKNLFFYLRIGTILFITYSCTSKPVQKETLPLVKTEIVKLKHHSKKIGYPAIIQSNRELSVAFKVNGQLENIINQEGAFVNKGMVLASLDPHDFEVQYQAAKATYKQAKQEFSRIKELYKAKTVSPNDYEKAEAAYEITHSKYIAAKDALEYTQIRAPFDGYITNVYRQKGEIISAGMPVMNYIDTNNFKVEIHLPEQDYNHLNKLNNAQLVLGDTLVNLSIESISHQATVGQLYKVVFKIPQIQFSQPLLSGMNSQVILSYEKEEDLPIPSSALFTQENKAFVWKINEKKCTVKTPVYIQSINNEYVFVTGLRNGDKIVVTGTNELKEGQQVEEMLPVSTSNIGELL